MASKLSMGPRRTPPDPGLRSTVELVRGHRCGLLDLLGIGKALSGKGRSTEEPPPPLLEIQPTRSFRDEDLVDSGMRGQPLLNRRALVTGEIVGDEIEIAVRIGLVDCLKQLQVPDGVARRSSQGHLLAVSNPQ